MASRNADVVVIGGGIIGAASAYYLAQAGLSVEVIEKYDLGYGASGRNPGFVWLHTRRPGPALDLAMVSRRVYDTLQDELDHDFEFRPNGGMIFFYTSEQAQVMKEFVEARVADGLEMALLDASEARELAPALSEGVAGATFCPLDAQIRTAKLVHGFALAAQRSGARVSTGVEAFRVDTVSQRVQTTDGDISYDRVVIATGAWTPFFLDHLGLTVPIKPMRLQVVSTEPTAVSLERPLYGPRAAAQYDLFHNLPSYREEYFRTEEEKDYELPFLELACQTKSGRFLLGCPMDFPGFVWEPDLRGVALTSRVLPTHLPALREARFERAWAGLLPHTPDSLPIIDRLPDEERVFLASGHVFGNVAAPATAQIVTSLITGSQPPLDPRPFAIDRAGLATEGTAW